MNKITQDPTEQFHDEKQIPPLESTDISPCRPGWLLGPGEMPASHGHRQGCARAWLAVLSRGWGVGLREGLTPEQSHRNRCFKSAPSGWCVVCKGGGRLGRACGAGQPGPGVSSSAKRMLSRVLGWQGRRV